MARIEISEEEDFEKAIKRFKRLVEKEGIVKECKRRQYFIKPSTKKYEKNKKIKNRELRNIRKLKKMKQY